MIVVSIVVFILIFALIVWVHELGHFLAAKKVGVGVEEFAFGFPPKLISWRRGETVYAINAIPLGGYVKLKGEDTPSDDKNSLNKKNPGQKAIIMVAGITMNLILAWVLFTVLLVTPISWRGSGGTFVAGIKTGSAAEKANFKVGDIVLKIDNTDIKSASELSKYTASHKNKSVSITFRRYGREEVIKVTLGSNSTPLGLAIDTFSLSDVAQVPIWKAPILSIEQIGSVIGANAVFFTDLFKGIVGLGPHVPTDQVSGPVGIYGLVAQFIALGWIYVLLVLAQLSLAVAIFNVLPIPALDGGRLLFIGMGKVLGKRMVSQQVEAIVHAIGFVFLIGLFLTITWHDILNLIK